MSAQNEGFTMDVTAIPLNTSRNFEKMLDYVLKVLVKKLLHAHMLECDKPPDCNCLVNRLTWINDDTNDPQSVWTEVINDAQLYCANNHLEYYYNPMYLNMIAEPASGPSTRPDPLEDRDDSTSYSGSGSEEVLSFIPLPLEVILDDASTDSSPVSRREVTKDSSPIQEDTKGLSPTKDASVTKDSSIKTKTSSIKEEVVSPKKEETVTKGFAPSPSTSRYPTAPTSPLKRPLSSDEGTSKSKTRDIISPKTKRLSKRNSSKNDQKEDKSSGSVTEEAEIADVPEENISPLSGLPLVLLGESHSPPRQQKQKTKTMKSLLSRIDSPHGSSGYSTASPVPLTSAYSSPSLFTSPTNSPKTPTLFTAPFSTEGSLSIDTGNDTPGESGSSNVPNLSQPSTSKTSNPSVHQSTSSILQSPTSEPSASQASLSSPTIPETTLALRNPQLNSLLSTREENAPEINNEVMTKIGNSQKNMEPKITMALVMQQIQERNQSSGSVDQCNFFLNLIKSVFKEFYKSSGEWQEKTFIPDLQNLINFAVKVFSKPTSNDKTIAVHDCMLKLFQERHSVEIHPFSPEFEDHIVIMNISDKHYCSYNVSNKGMPDEGVDLDDNSSAN